MSIVQIVDRALAMRYLTPAMEAEISQICDSNPFLTQADYLALDRLMGALLTEQIMTLPRKQFINVMEELVQTEIMGRVAQFEEIVSYKLDLGDIAAFALNRLPPLYATTQEGANYQRTRAQADLLELIQQKVDESIQRSLAKPEFFPERSALGQTSGQETLAQVSSLLQSYAATYAELPQEHEQELELAAA